MFFMSASLVHYKLLEFVSVADGSHTTHVETYTLEMSCLSHIHWGSHASGLIRS